jgi:Ca-activated chloride channel family protein
MKRFLLIIMMFAALTGFKRGTTHTISGTVYTADDKLPLPGVTVLLKGTSTGTQTNAKGAYSITVPDNNATLIFNFIGFQPQYINIGSKTKIDVYLKVASSSLNEVVVTAYGVQKRKDVTGSVAQINNNDALKSTPTKASGPGIGDCR